MTYSDAIGCIRASNFYDNPAYEWAKPIIDAVLMDSFDDDVVRNVLDSVGGEVQTESTEAQKPPARSTLPTDANLPRSPLAILKINSIDTIENVGLVQVDSPIRFQDGLTVFYGKNASGKSSIFSALINTLGIAKKAAPNLSGTDKNLACSITVATEDGDKSLRWSGGAIEPIEGARILDSDSCIRLVEKEQANNFELAHLRTEYFDLLGDALEQLSGDMEERKSNASNQYASLKETLEAVIPQIGSLEKRLRQQQGELSASGFTESDTQELTALEAKLVILRQEHPATAAKRLESASQAAQTILEILGGVTYEKSPTDESVLRWSQSAGLGSEALNAAVSENTSLKRAAEQSSIASLAGALPNDWPESSLWRDFVLASLAFVSSLGSEEAEQFTKEQCPLCLQTLESPEAKALFVAYRALEGEQFKKLEASESKLNRAITDLESLWSRLGDLPANLALVNAEVPPGPEGATLTLNVRALTDYLKVQAAAVESREPVPVATSVVSDATILGRRLVEFCNSVKSEINTLRGQAKDREAEVSQIAEAADTLRLKKNLIAHSAQILMMLESSEAESDFEKRLLSLTQLKRAVSTTRTAFSRDEPLSVFKKCLEDEYKSLDYQPPSYWSISTKTGQTGNMRVYSLGDRRLSEIFSEGERKIHAIADFLAEGEMNKFGGVYVFDDPVNSLDEERMECVSNRILRLVASGHQVVVFTHSLFFLNMLVDPATERVTRVERLDTAVIVEPDVLLGDANEMVKRMKTIDERMEALAGVPAHERDEYSLRNIYDLMSGYLESYFEQKILFNVINRYRPNLRMHSLDKLRSIDASKLSQLQELYGQTSRKGSRHSQPQGSAPPKYEQLCKHVEILRAEFRR